MASRWLDRVGLTNAAEFLHTIDQHKNVRAIVWGHVHQAYDGLRKGVRLLATPSTCAQFLPHSDEFRGRSPAARLPDAGAARRRFAADGGRVGRTTLRWFLALGLFGCLSVHAAGPVWAIRGAHNTVYLAGSIHMLPAGRCAAAGGLRSCLRGLLQGRDGARSGQARPAGSDELDDGSRRAAQGHDLRGLLGEARYGRRQRPPRAPSACPSTGFDGQAPWMVGIEITDSAYTHEGFDPDQGRRGAAAAARAGGRHGRPRASRPCPEELGGLDRAVARGSGAHARPDAR